MEMKMGMRSELSQELQQELAQRLVLRLEQKLQQRTGKVEKQLLKKVEFVNVDFESPRSRYHIDMLGEFVVKTDQETPSHAGRTGTLKNSWRRLLSRASSRKTLVWTSALSETSMRHTSSSKTDGQ